MPGEISSSPRLYLEIFAAIIRDKRVSHGAFRLWHCYPRDYTNADSKCFPGQRRLAEDIGCRTHSLKNWTNELSASGWLLFEPPKAGCGICYTVLDGSGQPLRKSASPTVAENSNSDRCSKQQQGVAENSNDALRKSATKVRSPFNQERGEEKTPPASAAPKPVNKKREMWQLITNKKKTEDLIAKEKEKATPDTQILSALRAELKRTNDELRALGASGEAAKPTAPLPIKTAKPAAELLKHSPELAAKWKRDSQAAIEANQP